MVGLSLPEYGNLYKKCVHTVALATAQILQELTQVTETLCMLIPA